jgi:hypothetical protein
MSCLRVAGRVLPGAVLTAWEVRVVAAIAVRPWLWRSAWRFVPNGWWHWPPSLRPPQEYIDFRMTTAYGDPEARPSHKELVSVLYWCRRSARL